MCSKHVSNDDENNDRDDEVMSHNQLHTAFNARIHKSSVHVSTRHTCVRGIVQLNQENVHNSDRKFTIGLKLILRMKTFNHENLRE